MNLCSRSTVAALATASALLASAAQAQIDSSHLVLAGTNVSSASGDMSVRGLRFFFE